MPEALGAFTDEFGVGRLKSDGMEVAEQRLTMFQRPHRMPVGQQRKLMNDSGFLRQAAPMLEQAHRHEQKIMTLFEQEATPKIGGGIMRDIVEYNSRGHKNTDDFGAARLRFDGSTVGQAHPNLHRGAGPFALDHAGPPTGIHGTPRMSLQPPGGRQHARQGPGKQGCFVPTAGILGISSFLFCELHLVVMVLALLRRFVSLTSQKRHRALRQRAFLAAAMSLLNFPT